MHATAPTAQVLKHLAIIMDGNGRWAEQHQLSRIEGHRKGTEVSEEVIDACLARGISHLTLYAFSEENWKRPEQEVRELMQLLQWYILSKQQKMLKSGIRFRTIGDIAQLPSSVQECIAETTELTKNNNKLTLILALSYGSQQEIVRAVEKLIHKGLAVSSENITRMLDTADFPDPDLLIRTSGEYRMSNFMLWQLAYTELYFTNTLWPDFSERDLNLALAEFSKRERRFGLTSEQLKEKTCGSSAASS